MTLLGLIVRVSTYVVIGLGWGAEYAIAAFLLLGFTPIPGRVYFGRRWPTSTITTGFRLFMEIFLLILTISAVYRIWGTPGTIIAIGSYLSYLRHKSSKRRLFR